jgi:hypothetical protein
VEQRLGELPAEYAELIPALRGLLQWDPQARPDGQAAERQLLTAASKLAGDPLRVWARDVIGALVSTRETESKARTDELIGKTLEVQSLGLSSDNEASVSKSAPPEVKAATEKPAAPPAAPLPTPAPAAKAPKTAPRGRSSTGMVGLLVVGVLLGVAVGLLALLVVGVAVLIAVR